MFVFFRCLLIGSGLLPAVLLAAGPDWSFCRSGAVPTATTGSLPNEDEATRVTADSLNSSSRDSLMFDGSVEVRGQGRVLKADRVRVFDEPKRFEATGDIEIRAPDLLIRSDSAMLSEADKRGVFTHVEYELPEHHAYGRATRVATTDNLLMLDSASYSSCEVEDPDWVINAGKIKLDRAAGFGSATNAMLKFMDVPLIYLPYITFPIDDQRRTGFLYPVIGSGNVAGATLSTPFYWNMAPNYDMTLTPRFMDKRGIMAIDELRYLGKKTRSKLHLEYLKHDRVLDTERYNVSVDHENQLSRHWKLQVQGSYVSDFDYLTDFSNGLNTSSRTHLERYAQLVYHSRHWKGVVRSQVYQTIDPTIPLAERPYRRLPQVTTDGDLPFLHDHLNLHLATDFTRFTHDNAVEGRRYEFAPTLDYRWVRPGVFIKPSLTWHYTYYDLDPFADSAAEVIKRQVPVASIDSGLVFERSMQGDNTLTLEPRLFYLYAPFRDQSNIPVFDSNEPAFIFSSLFRENRFSGLDRIGDANQMTLALTSRMFDNQSGRELFHASLGQIHYFRDRKVTLPNSERDMTTRSNYLAEFSTAPWHSWIMSGHLVSDSDLAKAEVVTANLGYRGKGNRIANIEHRFRRLDDVNQTALSWAWPVSRNWKFLGRWLYSHNRNVDLEVIAGVEYESCCWKTRLVARRYILDEQEEYNNSIYVQLVLKGLGSFGSGSTLVEQSISGYQVNDE